MTPKFVKCALSIAIAGILGGCQTMDTQPTTAAQQQTFSEQQVEAAETQAQELFDKYSQWEIESSPMAQSYRGLKEQYDQWDDLSEEFRTKLHQEQKAFLQQANAIQYDALSPETQLTLDVLIYGLRQDIDSFAYRHMNFPVNQMFGLHTQIPTFMANIHQISSIEDARDYITRIKGVSTLMNQLIAQMKDSESKGVRPPEFVFDAAIAASENQLKGYPLDNSKVHHILWTDFMSKIKKLDLYQSSSKVLEDDLKSAMRKHYRPAYKKLVNYLIQSKAYSAKDTGLHQYKDGPAFYELALNNNTTTNLSADEIHELGLKEVARLKNEIKALLPKLGQPSVEALFEYTRTNKQDLYYLNSDEAMADTHAQIKAMNQWLPKAFEGIPNIPMEVRPVEAYREASSPVAFYNSPSDDGKRPGIYYMNLSKLNDMPKFQFEALTYHETIPGHHLQAIYALSSKSIPDFRRYSFFTAYAEGWALYAETLSKEMGGYKTAWTEYGRLLMELWRANRLVLDTGLHHKGWDIDQALEFRMKNSPFTEADSLNAIKRYIVMPGQATSYKVGQLKLLEIRKNAQDKLGSQFHLGRFHQFILNLGPLPLSLLEQQVDQWVQGQKA